MFERKFGKVVRHIPASKPLTPEEVEEKRRRHQEWLERCAPSGKPMKPKDAVWLERQNERNRRVSTTYRSRCMPEYSGWCEIGAKRYPLGSYPSDELAALEFGRLVGLRLVVANGHNDPMSHYALAKRDVPFGHEEFINLNVVDEG